MSNPTLVEGLVKGIGTLAPVFNDSQETPQARIEMAPKIIKSFFIIKKLTPFLSNCN